MFFSLILHAQDTTESIKNIPEFNGQFSTWLHYNSSNQCGFYCGGRYIPTLHYDALSGDNYKIDFETSANLYGTLGFCGKDSLLHDGEVNPYRAWMRFSGKQFEFRAGLQKLILVLLLC